MENQPLEVAIQEWNGGSVDELINVYVRFGQRESFVDEIVGLLPDESSQIGATWLLKQHLENGNSLEVAKIAEIYRQLPILAGWEARLHVLQCIPYMPIAEPDRATAEAFIRACLTDDNKFVRAWAYNGFAEMARQYPCYRGEVEALFIAAIAEEAPSVRARIRNIAKRGF